eukprot:11178768-Lingulodinium_polyedra.AAC.1
MLRQQVPRAGFVPSRGSFALQSPIRDQTYTLKLVGSPQGAIEKMLNAVQMAGDVRADNNDDAGARQILTIQLAIGVASVALGI